MFFSDLNLFIINFMFKITCMLNKYDIFFCAAICVAVVLHVSHHYSHLTLQLCWCMCICVSECATALFTDSGGYIRKSASLSLTLTPMKRIQSSPNLYTLAGIKAVMRTDHKYRSLITDRRKLLANNSIHYKLEIKVYRGFLIRSVV